MKHPRSSSSHLPSSPWESRPLPTLPPALGGAPAQTPPHGARQSQAQAGTPNVRGGAFDQQFRYGLARNSTLPGRYRSECASRDATGEGFRLSVAPGPARQRQNGQGGPRRFQADSVVLAAPPGGSAAAFGPGRRNSRTDSPAHPCNMSVDGDLRLPKLRGGRTLAQDRAGARPRSRRLAATRLTQRGRAALFPRATRRQLQRWDLDQPGR